MRIVELDLRAFGPFTEASLNFGPGSHGLHVVYGANEAGKSSALRALRQLLFGIPHNSPDNFLHAHGDLRIGAKLAGADGDMLDCIRRKGKTNTLRGPDDASIVDPAALSKLLGGLDEAAFELQFGIDNATLEKGGRAIVEGHGEVGVALFAAGSGIVDLRRVQGQLEEEAEALFKPRGSVQRINKALADLSRVKQEVKSSQLPTAEWVQHDEALTEAQQRKTALDADLLAKTAEMSRLERIVQALPLVARRRTVLLELAQLADVPLLDGDFSERRRQAIPALAAAQTAQQESSKLIDQLERQIAELKPPPELLDRATAIGELFAELGAYAKAQKDRPRLVAERQLFEDEAHGILRELGRPADLTAVESLRITVAERQQVHDLSNDQKALEGRRTAAAAAAERLRSQIAELESQLDHSSLPADTPLLKQSLQRARQHGDLDGRLAAAIAKQTQLQQQAGIELGRLGLWTGSLEELEKLAVPALETIDRFDAELAQGSRELESCSERIADLDRQSAQLDQALERLQREQDVPTEEDLGAIRARREAGWRLVRQAWESGTADADLAEPFVAEFAAGSGLAPAYESSVARADNVADRLRREADHVAKKARLIADRQSLTQQRQSAAVNREQAIARCHQTDERWRDQWRPLAIEPLSPREMRAWHTRQSALVNLAAEARRQSMEIQELERLMASCRQELERSLAAAGHKCDEPMSFAALVPHAEAIGERLESERIRQQKSQDDLKRLRGELADAERQLAEASRALDSWRQQWGQAVGRLGLTDAASPGQANQVLTTLDELRDKLRLAEDRRHRIEGIDRDAADYSQGLMPLAALLPAAWDSQPVIGVVTALHDRLSEAQRIQVRLDELVVQNEREQARLDKARREIRDWQAAIETMCREARCQSAEQLPDVERQSGRRRQREEQVRDLESRIIELSAGAELNAFIDETAANSADQLPLRIRDLVEGIKRLEDDRALVLQTIGSELAERKRMDGSARAAQAAEEASTLAAQIQTDVEQYRRLRLASAVLRSAIERYREKHQGPVVQRASDLFAELTLGSFEGLRADYDDSGQLVLVGVRAGGRQTVAVEGLSDGARDQLYLALRLASLECYLEQNEPIPFVVDDILIKFDDDRAAAALRALATIARGTQVIFFTHHEHLVNLAQAHVPPDLLSIHRLDCRSREIERVPALEPA
jgi:uncharacterized protein YhaN